MITIIDYGMGNLHSVQKGFERVGLKAEVTSDPDRVAKADRLVLPGVGAFRDCYNNLKSAGFVEPLKDHVKSGKPMLGICVGLQLLYTESEEFGTTPGLDIIPGKVVKFPTDMKMGDDHLKVPHMGWNRINIKKPSPILKGVEEGSHVYFVHSYYGIPDSADVIAAETTYGDVTFCSSIWKDNVMATQFHPEKSQSIGLDILKNFGAL